MRISALFLLLAFHPLATMTAAPPTNDPVASIDPERFKGKWYSLTSIPTFLDKNWRETIEDYTPRAKGGYDVYTTYRKADETRVRSIRSKLFPVKGEPDGAFKAQFFWPIKVPYRIIELAPDYSWMVGGSPDKKMLFILARSPSLPEPLMTGIVARCRERGYDVDKLQSQEHPATGPTFIP